MTSWRAAARFSCAATDIIRGQSKLAGRSYRAIFVQATSSTSSRSHCEVFRIPESVHFQPVRGFAASSAIYTASASAAPPPPPPSTGLELDQDGSERATSSAPDEAIDDDEDLTSGPAATSELQMQAIDGLSRQENDELLRRIQSSSKKQQRHILSQLLSGNELTGANLLGEEANAAELAQKSQSYSMKLVDVNSTNKGTKSGGVQSFSAMVVVGNHEGLLGHGTGKAAELVPAIRKASLRAMNNVTYVPRYERFTILHPVDTKYGKCKLRMYPLASGGGIRANVLLSTVANLAGISAIGIKLHGSRNARNSVKAMFQAFSELTTIERKAKELGKIAVEVVVGSKPAPKNRFRYAQRRSA